MFTWVDSTGLSFQQSNLNVGPLKFVMKTKPPKLMLKTAYKQLSNEVTAKHETLHSALPTSTGVSWQTVPLDLIFLDWISTFQILNI